MLDTEHRGPLFGLLPGPEYGTATTDLRPGDLLLLYTDGMVERRGEDIADSVDSLRKVLARCDGFGPQDTLARILDAYAYASDEHEDDTCLVALGVG
ncbi:SpoIIE family protein phosphatase [Streptomyces virginiae]|uniref:SpoIIE family protein phosphatase n=1 Tax=Streptomyces virginiae TaxID=1961 RepID=UPI003F541C79